MKHLDCSVGTKSLCASNEINYYNHNNNHYYNYNNNHYYDYYVFTMTMNDNEYYFI